MRILSITPPQDRKPRPFIIIRRKSHTVVDTETGNRITLPPLEAWEYYAKVNIII